MKTRIGLAAAAAAALAAFPAEAGMFKAKGFEPAVYYTGERPIERGDAVADLGILYIHGWGGGADDRTALCRRLAKNVAKRGAKPVSDAILSADSRISRRTSASCPFSSSDTRFRCDFV